MPSKNAATAIPLPRSWPERIKSAILHTISLAHLAITHARGWAADAVNPRARQAADIERLGTEVAMLREELAVKDARLRRTFPHRRPHYLPADRMRILELKAARGWSLAQAAKAFLVDQQTVADWLERVDESGPAALVQIAEPANKFPAFVRYVVQRLKTLCPTLGKVKITQALARAGLHLGATTVRRMLKGPPASPEPVGSTGRNGLVVDSAGEAARVVTAKRPNHVWHVDLTAVPIVSGYWATWLPWSLPQIWPFCWWVAVVVDHFSRRVMGLAVWKKPPTSQQVREFLARTIRANDATPKYIICDKGCQFWNDGFKRWCKRKRIRPRFGAVGQHGSIAIVERFIRSMKDEFTRRILLPLRQAAMSNQAKQYAVWFNQHRPHTSLAGRTPDEVYHGKHPASRYPRVEPRARWPRGSRCATPNVPIRGKPGARLELVVTFHAGNKNLPVVQIKQVA
ncbi:MAG: DDE-type integrase/transposase/recombinase [Phycisphaerae bacterium]|nr:DDE-type integrase/transposase/recombinase [Phycisphaerae bacterium]